MTNYLIVKLCVQYDNFYHTEEKKFLWHLSSSWYRITWPLGTRENYTIKLGSPANSSDNYRPVSLLSILSKILERHVYSMIADHLDETHTLYRWLSVGIQSRTIDSGCSPCNYFSLVLTFGREKIKSVHFFMTIRRHSINSVPYCPLLNKLIKSFEVSCPIATSLGFRLLNFQISMCGCRGRQIWHSTSTFWHPFRYLFWDLMLLLIYYRRDNLNSSFFWKQPGYVCG